MIIELPAIGRVNLLSNDYTKSDLFMAIIGWTRESTWYRFDPADGGIEQVEIKPLGPFDYLDDMIVERIMVTSHDGVEVPLTILRKSSVQVDGSNPTLLFGYGAYGISMRPYYNPLMLPWFENGGVYALANVRGGGEYGDSWHKAGHMNTKRNSWLDLNACAEYLIEKDYTNNSSLAIMGASMGGVLVGRAMTSRPDLYGAVISIVGCNNPVRIHRQANGPVNFPEFGNPLDPEEFPYVLAMDSYFAVKDDVDYPPMLITAGWNDARVEPWEPAKMAARMQQANPCGGPYLLRVGYRAGHRRIARSDYWVEHADRYAFLLWVLNKPG